jgi:hypothetical protein
MRNDFFRIFDPFEFPLGNRTLDRQHFFRPTHPGLADCFVLR